MKTVIRLSAFFLFIFYYNAALYSQSADEFKARRSQLISQMTSGSILIIRTPDASGMFDYTRRGGNFYYLTGIDEPSCTLVLFAKDFKTPPRQPSYPSEILFIRPINSDRANWDALTLGIEGAETKFGIADARSNAEASEFIGHLLTLNFPVLYMDVSKSTSVNGPLTDDEQLIKQARDHGASFTIQSPATLLGPILAKKSPAEIELMRKVVNITCEAQKEAMRSIKAGMYEYQVDAIIRYVFTVNGAGSVSFPTIIGSGTNSVVLHWMENSRKMENGDMVVVDCGAENQMYCADITRTYPVSGKFTERQKAIYEVVLAANEEAIRRIAPGVSMDVVNQAADSVLSYGMLRLELIKYRKDFKIYYYHGLSHHIGLKGAFSSAPAVLEPGMIITIEPGIYVREEKIGVRIEDDVLVTETGYDVLSKNAPKQVAEIERGMKDEGMDVLRNVIK
jgi:Xaa-Pro aminopeptidase